MRVVVALLALACAATVPSLQAQQPVRATIAVVLDCSESMAEDAPSGDGVQEVSDSAQTRFDLAKAEAQKLIRQLANDGNYRIGVWFFGHRLSWDDQTEPQLAEQTDYLGLTNSFNILTQLLPGDDVEQVHSVDAINEATLAQIDARFEILRPWGESPLFLSVQRAVEAVAADTHAAPKGVIVLTSGVNKQWVCKNRRSNQDVLRTLQGKTNLGIHFAYYGPETAESETARTQLKELADRSGGSFQQAGIGNIMERIENSLAGAQQVSTSGQPLRNLTGQVIYFKKPVRKAKVVLQGSGLLPVETDSTGAFLFQGVEPGSYQLQVEGIARNVIRNRQLEITVPAPPREMQPIKVDLP